MPNIGALPAAGPITGNEIVPVWQNGLTVGAAASSVSAANPIVQARGQIIGSSGNAPSSAGNIGEIISASAASVSLLSGTLTLIAQITLSGGNWILDGNITFDPAGTTTVSKVLAGISVDSTDFTPSIAAGYPPFSLAATLAIGVAQTSPVVRMPVLPTGTSTYYLLAESIFGVSTMTASGLIFATRIS